MALLPNALQKLIDELGQLPGVGKRTAERYALAILKRPKSRSQSLSQALSELHDKVSYCQKTFVLTEPDIAISPLYSDPGRDRTTIIVVEDPLDVIPIEKTGDYRGTYHVLGGLLSPIEDIGPSQLRIAELLGRIEEDKVREIILATSASVEGETTALYIQKQLADKNVKLTRLARGIPVGVDIEYADQTTISRALEGRTTV